MNTFAKKLVVGTLATMAVILAACGAGPQPAAPTSAPAEPTKAACAEMTKVRLQLQWVTQSQFAGYYAARDKGFYAAQCLDVEIKEGAVEIVPQQVVAAGDAEFGIAWVPKMLASREQGANLVNIGQVFQRSGTMQVGWADSGLADPASWKGKRIGTWGYGNEWEVFATLRKAGIDPADPNQVTVVQQPFDMSLLLNKELDMAQAEVYNEYAQLLEATNPETGELYKPEDFLVVDYNATGTAMLQDHIFSTAEYLKDNEDIAVRFLRASFQGWIFCRDHFDECVDIVLTNGPTLGESHMRWQLNEINALIWPSPNGIGIVDTASWEQTVKISLDFGVLTAQPSADAQRSDLATKALEGMTEDTKGTGFQKITVELKAGGE